MGKCKSKSYSTHDNGDRPFRVDICGKAVTVTRVNSVTLYPEKVFVGKSPLMPMTEFSGGHGKKFDGNSILLAFKDNKYVFVGHHVVGFVSKHEIVKFVSPVGANDIPYPFAVDAQQTYYLLLEDVKVDSKHVVVDKSFPYASYGHSGQKLRTRTFVRRSHSITPTATRRLKQFVHGNR